MIAHGVDRRTGPGAFLCDAPQHLFDFGGEGALARSPSSERLLSQVEERAIRLTPPQRAALERVLSAEKMMPVKGIVVEAVSRTRAALARVAGAVER